MTEDWKAAIETAIKTGVVAHIQEAGQRICNRMPDEADLQPSDDGIVIGLRLYYAEPEWRFFRITVEPCEGVPWELVDEPKPDP